MLSGRPGLRFALEALFLILLAVGAGLADLRPFVIVLVMAGGWALVAIVEFTAQRVSSAPLSYLLPSREAEPPEDERVEWPMPEERTVVAPPEQLTPPEPAPEPEPVPEPVAVEPNSELDPAPDVAAIEPEPEPEAVAVEPEPEAVEPEPAAVEPDPEPEPVLHPLPPAAEEAVPTPAEHEDTIAPPARRRRSFLRRRDREPEPEPQAPPRHVKLLPRRTAPEPSRAAQEVSELFDEPEEREEHGG